MIGKKIDDGRTPCWGRFPSVRLNTLADINKVKKDCSILKKSLKEYSLTQIE